MPTYAQIVTGCVKNQERCNPAQRSERLGNSPPDSNKDTTPLDERTDSAPRREWQPASRLPKRGKRGSRSPSSEERKDHSSQEEGTFPPKYAFPNQYATLRELSPEVDNTLAGDETAGEIERTAEYASESHGENPTRAVAARDAPDEPCWQDITTPRAEQINFLLLRHYDTPPIDYNEDWTSDEEDHNLAEDLTDQTPPMESKSEGNDQEPSLEQLYQQSTWFAGTRERGIIPFALRNPQPEESHNDGASKRTPADEQTLDDTIRVQNIESEKDRRARILDWFNNNPLNNDTSESEFSSSRLKQMPAEALAIRLKEEHREKNRAYAAKQKRRNKQLYTPQPTTEVVPSAHAELARWVPLLQHQISRRLETEQGYRTLEKIFNKSGKTLSAQELLNQADSDRKALMPNIPLDKWSKMVNKTVTMHKRRKLEKSEGIGNNAKYNTEDPKQKYTRTPLPRRQTSSPPANAISNTKSSTLLDDLLHKIERDNSRVTAPIPTALTTITNAIVEEVESKTTQITDVVDQYDIDADTSPLLMEHQSDPSYRILYKDVVKQIKHHKKRHLLRYGLTPTQIREITRSDKGKARRNKLKTIKMRLKKKDKKDRAKRISIVIREDQKPDLRLTVQPNWTIRTLLINICESRGYMGIGGQITVNQVQYQTEQGYLYLSKTGIEQGSVVTYHKVDYHNVAVQIPTQDTPR